MDGEIIRYYTEERYLYKFNEPNCPRCHHNAVKIYRRTKDDNQYEVYVCNKCKIVLGREMK